MVWSQLDFPLLFPVQSLYSRSCLDLCLFSLQFYRLEDPATKKVHIQCTAVFFMCPVEGIVKSPNFRMFWSYTAALSIPLSVVFITRSLGHTTEWSCWLPSYVDFGRFPDPLALSGSAALADTVVVWGFTDSHSRQPAGWSDLFWWYQTCSVFTTRNLDRSCSVCVCGSHFHSSSRGCV